MKGVRCCSDLAGIATLRIRVAFRQAPSATGKFRHRPAPLTAPIVVDGPPTLGALTSAHRIVPMLAVVECMA